MSYAPLPTVAQVGVTRQLIASKISEIASTEQLILDHEARIADLRSRIIDIRHEIVAHEAYLAAVRRLPFEVLGEIVALCATDPAAPVHILRDLACICKTWRDATLRTPKAWTKIDIYLTPNRERGRRRVKLHSLRDFQEWYDRSGCRKKDVSFDYRGNSEDHGPVLDLVISRAAELRSLATEDFNGKFLSSAMPNLEALCLRAFKLEETLIPRLALSSPRLSCLRLSTGGKEFDPFLGLVQTRLKSLIIGELSPADLFRILRAADGAFSNLESLNISFYPHRSPPWISDRSVVSLPRLRALFLSLQGAITPVLDILHLPRLESLALRTVASYSYERPSTEEVAALLRFPGDGDLQLRELRLEDLCPSDADLLRLLERTPRLELLAIVHGKTSHNVMTALASKRNQHSRWICPRLSRICIIADATWKSNDFTVSKDCMGTLITARLRANPTPSEGPPPSPVARITNVRVDDDDVVFDGLDWGWKHDRESYYLTHHIGNRLASFHGSRWWHLPPWGEL